MFGETTISYVKIGNHPIETAIYKWLALGVQVCTPPRNKKNLAPEKWMGFSRTTSFSRILSGQRIPCLAMLPCVSVFPFWGKGSVDVTRTRKVVGDLQQGQELNHRKVEHLEVFDLNDLIIRYLGSFRGHMTPTQTMHKKSSGNPESNLPYICIV